MKFYYFLVIILLTNLGTQTHADVTKVEGLEAMRSKLYDEKYVPFSGNSKAKTVIVDFFDYNCPFCRKVHEVIDRVSKCDPNVRIIYRHLPLLGPDSKILAKAALAAHLQGKFLEMHRWLMASGHGGDRSQVIEQAVEMGLNKEQFEKDLDGATTETVLDHTIEFALKLGARSVPALLINDQLAREALEYNDFIELLKKAHAQNKILVPKACVS